MQPPKSLKQLCGFVGMANHYWDLWPRQSGIFTPLIAKTGAPEKGEKAPPFVRSPEMQKAFDQMKALMAADVLCAYPNHNKPFHIFTDASNYQLGACIMQDDIPVAYYNKKLNSAQMNYATIDKELLCVIVTVNSVQCYLVLNSVFTQITKTFSMLVIHLNNVCNGSHMLMNTVLPYIMWKDHVM
jgi:hypothetical protein